MCSSTNKCQACDTSSFFFLKGTQCLYYKKGDCAVISNNGDCLECLTGYQYNEFANSCVKLPTVQLKNKCIMYDSNGVCIYCEEGFYPF